MSEKETKRDARPVRYKVEVTRIEEIPIKRRARDHVGRNADGADEYGYVYSQWFDDFESRSEQVFEQTVEGLDIKGLVSVVNNIMRIDA